MSIGQFILAFVTIFVATFVYRWQKNIDRNTIIQSELRVLYAKYLSKTAYHFMSQPFVGDESNRDRIDEFFKISDNETEIYVLRDQIYLLAPGNVRGALITFDKAFRSWKINFPTPKDDNPKGVAIARKTNEAMQSSRLILLETMRLDLESHTGNHFWGRKRLPDQAIPKVGGQNAHSTDGGE